MLLLKIVPKSCLYANALICSMLYGGLWLYCMNCCGDSRHPGVEIVHTFINQ